MTHFVCSFSVRKEVRFTRFLTHYESYWTGKQGRFRLSRISPDSFPRAGLCRNRRKGVCIRALFKQEQRVHHEPVEDFQEVFL
jgi:hypothetical protein